MPAPGKGEIVSEGGTSFEAVIAFWNILVKDMRAYYLKPPNITGQSFSTRLDGHVFLRSGRGMEELPPSCPASWPCPYSSADLHAAVTWTFEKKERAFTGSSGAHLP
jgi:ABC-2 type transport system permease protein